MEIGFSQLIFEILPILQCIQIRLVRAELFHADGWTEGQVGMTKPMVTFRNFSERT